MAAAAPRGRLTALLSVDRANGIRPSTARSTARPAVGRQSSPRRDTVMQTCRWTSPGNAWFNILIDLPRRPLTTHNPSVVVRGCLRAVCHSRLFELELRTIRMYPDGRASL